MVGAIGGWGAGSVGCDALGLVWGCFALCLRCRFGTVAWYNSAAPLRVVVFR